MVEERRGDGGGSERGDYMMEMCRGVVREGRRALASGERDGGQIRI